MSETEETKDEIIDGLKTNIEKLKRKCARLECQNILVSVQQLDIFARWTAWILSFFSLYLYWRLVSFGTKFLPALLDKYAGPFPDAESSFSGQLMLIVVKVLLMLVPYVYNRATFGSFHRRFEVFAVTFVVMMRIRQCRRREQLFMTPDTENVKEFGEDTNEAAIWDANYEVSARFLYVSILRLRGLWTKSAQYMSSRADFMPASYVRELKKLQDQAPPTSWTDVEHMLPANTKKELNDIDETPLASASIGQVHTAFLKSTEQKVVLKVQHPHARTLLTDDFWSLKVISRILAWMEPEYAFIEVLMREWATEARKELDFHAEAANLVAAKKVADSFLAESGGMRYAKTSTSEEPVPFQVEVPTPIHNLCSRNALVMTFSEGTRVDNFDQIAKWGIPRDALMDGITQIISYMMYCSDIFNGDPHPGNILIRKGTAKSEDGFTIVLLDWGLAKRLPESKRIAFCKLAYAAATLDFGLLLDAFKNVGLQMKRENVAEDMEGMRFFLRDMAPSGKARKRIKAFIKHDQARIQKRKRGEKMVMSSKAYPGEFFFFVRVNELLHGLGSRMDIELPYLDLVKPYAELGIRGLYKASPRDLSIGQDDESDFPLNAKLNNVLDSLNEQGQIAGAQIHVLDRTGRCIANVVKGHMGGLKSHIPMTENTLVLGFSCTKAIATTMAHAMVAEGYLTYDEPICERLWLNFCPSVNPPDGLAKALALSEEETEKRWKWKRSITLRHILTHEAGLWSALPAKMTIKSMASCEKCCAAFEYNSQSPEETILPSSEPGTSCEYHFMSFGWLVAGALRGAYAALHDLDDVSFETVYEEVLATKLSTKTLKQGFRPCGGSGGFELANAVAGDVRASAAMQSRRESKVYGEDSSNEGFSEDDLTVISTRFRGKEFLLDPRIWNCEEAIVGNVPSAGGRFSAAGLAHFYHDVARGGVMDSATLERVTTPTEVVRKGTVLEGVTNIAQDGNYDRTALGFGYQLIRLDNDPPDRPSAFGHAGVGGSIGFHHVGQGLSVGLMLNKADGGKELTTEILMVVADHFNL